MLQSLSRPDSFSSPLLYGPYPFRLGALAGLPKEITPASLETCRHPPLTAKINCSPSPCIVSPSLSLSGERAASLVLPSFPCVFFKIAANETVAHAWVQRRATTTERWICFQLRAAGSQHAPCDSVLPLSSLTQQHIWQSWTWRAERGVMWSRTGTSGFVAAVVSPLVSWAELLHYTKLHAAVPKWLPLRFRLCGVREVSTGRKYVLLRMHTD